MPSHLETSSRESEKQKSWPYRITWGRQSSCRQILGMKGRCGALSCMHRPRAALPCWLATLCAVLCALGLLREAHLERAGQPKDSWLLPCPGLNVLTTSHQIIRAKQLLIPQATGDNWPALNSFIQQICNEHLCARPALEIQQ